MLAENGHKLHLVKESQIINYIASKLSDEDEETLRSLPEEVARQLALERDPHGNVQVSRIETESLIVTLLGQELEKHRCCSCKGGLLRLYGYGGQFGSSPKRVDT